MKFVSNTFPKTKKMSNNFEVQKRVYRNEAIDDYNLIKRIIQQAEDTIYRLTYEEQQFRVTDIITKKEKKLEEYRVLELELEKKIKDIDSGLVDEDIKNELTSNRLEAEQKKLKSKKVADCFTKKKGFQPITNTTKRKFAKENAVRRAATPKEVNDRESSIEYERFKRNCASLPDYLATRLKKEPNNFGIAHNGTWFMGNLPETGSKVTIEAREVHGRGGTIYSHVYTDIDHTIYEKKSSKQIARSGKPFTKHELIFVSKTPRRRMNFGYGDENAIQAAINAPKKPSTRSIK